MDTIQRKPKWLKTQFPTGKKYKSVKEIVESNKLHTICTSGKCPNIAECWGNGTATFMILGDICTRSCKFCATKSGKPEAVDHNEPERLAKSIKLMGLKHAVITSVDRDDLEDKGAGIWAETILSIKKHNPEITIETLIPDFDGEEELVMKVVNAKPDIISHNVETVRRLTPLVRSRAKFDVSLKVLKIIADSGVRAKSGIMAGLGETEEEVFDMMDELREAGCTVLTIGQYLRPTKEHWPVHEYVTPEQFKRYEEAGLAKGFKYVESQPLVRSSYHAEKHVK
ncbi:MAG: lipoyl synthase [Bacteroidota bacterium]|nr:lipoyl synthase [Bacteroidota bacterium]